VRFSASDDADTKGTTDERSSSSCRRSVRRSARSVRLRQGGKVTVRPGTGYVRSEGANSKGRKFANFYHFAPCGEQLVLVSIAENPQ
jgi:hypothetical protein